MENFIVSARKYRPATFQSVVGQKHITSTLKNAIARAQLAHAYLFCGPRGVGKTTCARIFAKAINCQHLTAEGEACNECESCRAFNEGRSFNIHELDAASNNSVDDIRNLTDQVRIPPQVGRYSVYIIDEVHMLSLQAFNAFLKTLEEPPAHAIFILATTEKHKIIPTILSRCQIYDFNRIRVEDTVEYLKYIASQEGISYDDESLHVIAQKADGGMRDALSMFDKVVSFCGNQLSVAEVASTLNVLDYDTYFTVTDHILAGDYTQALLLFDEVLRKGFSGQTFVAGLNSHFRDLLMCKNPQTLPLLEVTGSVAERYKAQAVQCPVPLLFEGINLLTAVDSSLRTATNQRLHVELGLMKLCGLGQKKNNDTLTPQLPPLTGAAATSDGSRTATSGGNCPVSASVASNPASPTNVRPAGPTGTIPRETPPIVSATRPVAMEPAGKIPTSKEVISTPPTPAAPRTAPAATNPDTPSAAVPADPASPTTTAPASPVQTEASFSGSAMPTPTASFIQSSLSTDATSRPASILSGRSILSILNNAQPAPTTEEEPDEETSLEETVDIDDTVEETLIQGCARFARELMETRPRMGNIFQEAKITTNRVSLNVPNESSYDELMHSLSEMKMRLAEISGLHVPIDFEVKITSDTKGLKPIKVEDRLRYLTQKNPLLTTLRQKLELDVE